MDSTHEDMSAPQRGEEEDRGFGVLVAGVARTLARTRPFLLTRSTAASLNQVVMLE